ncbi:MAG: redoxin domain-containing protein [Chloroflexota bacterium]|nr:redoxin domain-containing protein [Chloroflexota bacterium]
MPATTCPNRSQSIAAAIRSSRSFCPNVSGNNASANDGRPISRCITPSCQLRVVSPYFRPYTRSYAKVSHQGEPEQIEKDGTRVVLVSGGSREQNQEMVAEYKLSCPLVIQEGHEISDLYGSSWTPFGFVVDEEGNVAGKGVVNDVHVLGELLARDATAGGSPKSESA